MLLLIEVPNGDESLPGRCWGTYSQEESVPSNPRDRARQCAWPQESCAACNMVTKLERIRQALCAQTHHASVSSQNPPAGFVDMAHTY